MCAGKENGTEIYGLEDHLPRQGGLIQSYNENTQGLWQDIRRNSWNVHVCSSWAIWPNIWKNCCIRPRKSSWPIRVSTRLPQGGGPDQGEPEIFVPFESGRASCKAWSGPLRLYPDGRNRLQKAARTARAGMGGTGIQPASGRRFRNKERPILPPDLSMRRWKPDTGHIWLRWRTFWPVWRQGMFPGMRWKPTNGSWRHSCWPLTMPHSFPWKREDIMLLFKLVNEFQEKTSLIVTANYSLTEWLAIPGKLSQRHCLTDCSTVVRLYNCQETAIGWKTGKQFLAIELKIRTL